MATLNPLHVAAAAKAGGFPDSQLGIATAVAFAESSWNASAFNGSCCYGLWQINKSAHPDLWAKFGAGDKWKIPSNNARMAFEIWRRAGQKWGASGGGGNPWAAYGNSRYRSALGPANAAVSSLKSKLAAAGQSLADLLNLDAGGFAASLRRIIGSVVPGAATAMDALSEASQAWQQLHKMLEFLSDKHNWQRVGTIGLGGTLVIIAIIPLLAGVLPFGRALKFLGMAKGGKIGKVALAAELAGNKAQNTSPQVAEIPVAKTVAESTEAATDTFKVAS